MNGVIAFLIFVVVVGTLIFAPPLAAPYESLYGEVTVLSCAKALTVCAIAAICAGFLIRRIPMHGSYLLKLFLFALLARVLIATAIFVFNGQDFFGGDAWTYDHFGALQMAGWTGDRSAQTNVDWFVGTGFASSWGMLYIVAGIYSIIGRNMLAIQLLNAVLGAATAPIIFLCAEHVFNNRKVARVAGLAVAFYPSLVLWSSQGLKDGPTVFFLALSILATLRLGHKLTLRYLAILLVSLVGVLAFRFYIFYMMVAAIIGAYVIGMKAFTAQSMARQFIVVLVIGLSFTYFGVTRYATAQFEQFGNLEQLNRSRQDLATSAKSGFGRDVDVSTTSGALSTIPTGLVYLLFAPFPWQLGSLRQSLTLPEMVVWWAAFPLLILGAWFSIRYRLRQMAPILIFTSMLTLAYSVFQGNVGTAYRQRGQILVFYFIFVAVGSVLVKEKRDQRRRRAAEELRLATLGLKPGLATPEQRVS
jgi:4-amino-4-deoxy-L-arabinose transferase-like glycosyltransferase